MAGAFRSYARRRVTVVNENTGEAIVDEADVVISARGTLNHISWPNIPGLSDMKIPVMHSAAWDDRSVMITLVPSTELAN